MTCPSHRQRNDGTGLSALGGDARQLEAAASDTYFAETYLE